MDIKDKVIDVFENRIMQLITITDFRQLPKWDDADVLECLLKEYRRITRNAADSESRGSDNWSKEDELAETEGLYER